MTLTDWATRWQIPLAALNELAHLTVRAAPQVTEGSEDYVKSNLRLEAARLGVYLFRNNVGAGKIEGGGYLRWGLANDSHQLNKAMKSADLVGIKRRLITTQDVGTYIGQFVSRETKLTDWKYSGSAEENAQLAWATLINGQGGDAKIVNGPGSF